MDEKHIIEWLLKGDVSIQYQVYRDLLNEERPDLQERIGVEGWGGQFLSKRKANGHWGDRFYQPKWISTHYTLLDLRNLALSPTNRLVQESINLVLDSNLAQDGGIALGPSTFVHSDVCVNGMFLNYASYFKAKEKRLTSIVDSIIKEIMPDGGFNCRSTRSGATHSSLHSTLSVLEGIFEFQKAGYNYRHKDLRRVKESSEQFIFMHHFFLSDKTGEIINKDFLKMPYPSRWKYNILRALDYFQYADVKWDDRMAEAFDNIEKKRNRNGTWIMQAAHPGKVHFVMEKTGIPSRWNTLRAMRVLNHFHIKLN